MILHIHHRQSSLFFLISFAIIIFQLVVPGILVEGTTITACPSATTFDALVLCLVDADHMPQQDSNGFVIPSDSDLDDWYNAVWDMLTIVAASTSSTTDCGTLTLGGDLASLYEYVTFTDTGTGVTYCVLVELATVGQSTKKGWGTYITRLNPSRNLHFQVPHPIFDINTGTQNADIFVGTEGMSFLLTGTHRNANTAFSSCQGCGMGDYKESDAAHNIKHMFHSTTRATLNWHNNVQGTNFVVLQLHGFGKCVCNTDMFLTYGRPTSPQSGDCLTTLQTNLRNNLPGPISVPGDLPKQLLFECAFNGGSNTQGRILNGVDPNQVCGSSATSYSGKFIHIEQEPQFRDTPSYIQGIVNALITTFPTGEECTSQPPTSGGCNAIVRYYASWLQEKIQGVFFHTRH